jgi:hypothetical protein
MSDDHLLGHPTIDFGSFDAPMAFAICKLAFWRMYFGLLSELVTFSGFWLKAFSSGLHKRPQFLHPGSTWTFPQIETEPLCDALQRPAWDDEIGSDVLPGLEVARASLGE